MKKEERLKEGFHAWNIELMKPCEEDRKEGSIQQAMLQEAKMTEEEVAKKD